MSVSFSWLSTYYSFSIKNFRLISLKTNAFIRDDALASKSVKEVIGGKNHLPSLKEKGNMKGNKN